MLRVYPQLVEMAGESEEAYSLAQILVSDLEDLWAYVSDLVATIPHSIYVVNPGGIIIDANPTLEQLIGWPLEKLLGEKYSVIFADEAAAEETNKEIIEKGQLKGKEVTLLSKHGKKTPVSIFAQLRTDDFGNASYVATLIDTTDRKRAEEKVKHSTEKMIVAMEDAIKAMAMTVELRDPYTAGHQRRVA